MFKRDLLMIDMEFTGIDIAKHEIIQIAAIVLDKKTLKEKQSFMTYVKPKNWKNRQAEAIAINNITWDQLKDAPDIKKVLQKFNKTFKSDLTPTLYGGRLDTIFLSHAYRDSNIKYPFDYHMYDIWPLCYTFMAKHKQLKNKGRHLGFSLENVGDFLGVKRMADRHDALGDCLYQAAVLRALIKAMKAERKVKR